MKLDKYQRSSRHYEKSLLRIGDVIDITGLSRSSIYGLAAENLFPKSVPLVPGGKSRAWVYAEVKDWLDQRIAARDTEASHEI